MRISDWSSDVCSSDLFALSVSVPGVTLPSGGHGLNYHKCLSPRMIIRQRQVNERSIAIRNQRFQPHQRAARELQRWRAGGGVHHANVAHENTRPENGAHCLGESLLGSEAFGIGSRSEEHKTELQSLMPFTHTVFCF